MNEDLFSTEELKRMFDSVGIEYAENTGKKPGVYTSDGKYSTFADFIDPMRFLRELRVDGPSYENDYFSGTKAVEANRYEKKNRGLATETLSSYVSSSKNHAGGYHNQVTLGNQGRYAA